MAKIPTAMDMGFGQTQFRPFNPDNQRFATSPDMFGASQARVTSDLAAGLGDMAAKFEAANERVRSREDTIARARARREYSEQVNNALLNFQTEGDMTDPAQLSAFQQEMDAVEQSILQQHTGSADSYARLQESLFSISSEARNAASTAMNEAQRALVKQDLAEEITGLTRMVFNDPSKINQALMAGGSVLDEFSPSLTPQEELAQELAIRQEVMKSALTAFTSRGQYEEAQQLVDNNPQIMQLFPPQEARRLEIIIADGVREKDKAAQALQNQIGAMESVLGRSLSSSERMQVLGLTPRGLSPEGKGRRNAEMLGLEWDKLTPQQRYALVQGKLPDGDFDPQTDAGKTIADRVALVQRFGEGSPQVLEFDRLVEGAAMDFDPKSPIGQLIADKDYLLRQNVPPDDPRIRAIEIEIAKLDPVYQQKQDLQKNYRPAVIALQSFATETQLVNTEINSALSILLGTTIDNSTDIALQMEQGKIKLNDDVIGIEGAIRGLLPDSQRTELDAILNTLRGIVSFDTLKTMRESSPSGGALGGVSDTEGRLLAAARGTLDVSAPKSMLRTLIRIRQLSAATLEEKRRAFATDFEPLLSRDRSNNPALNLLRSPSLNRAPAQPTTAQPTTAQPATAQPATAQPATAWRIFARNQPATAQPTTAQPAEASANQPSQQPDLKRGLVLGLDERPLLDKINVENTVQAVATMQSAELISILSEMSESNLPDDDKSKILDAIDERLEALGQ